MGKSIIVTKEQHVTIESDAEQDNCTHDFPSFDWTLEDCVTGSSLLKGMDYIDVFDSGDSERTHISDATASHRATLSEVDMDDEEILDLWKNVQIEADTVPSVATLSSNVDDTVLTTAQKEEKERHIDAEYEKYKELGEQLLTRQKLPSKLKQRTFFACQA